MPYPSYVPEDLLPAREYQQTRGGAVFKTWSSFEWFVRCHRDELVAAGEYIPRRGPTGALVGPGFGRKAVEIMTRAAAPRERIASATGAPDVDPAARREGER